MKYFFRTETTQTKKIPHIAKVDKFQTNDCGNQLQHSVNKHTIILQASKHGLNTDQFKFWSESHYQSLLLLFSGKADPPPTN